MKWLHDNPVGMALLSISGLMLLLVLAMSIIWGLPVSAEGNAPGNNENSGTDTLVAAPPVSELEQLEVINERPVFNESRRPVIVAAEDAGDQQDQTIEVQDAPEVRLTGIIITPDVKVITLTPANNELENVIAREGESLTGEYVGWRVGSIDPRAVVLESSDGQQLELELQVHDQTIKEPPKPVVATPAIASQDGQPPIGEDGQPLSRAEQIRQRIAERREELRLEQEERQAQEQASQAEPAQQSGRSKYQDAMRNLLNRPGKDKESDDKKDG